MATTGTITLRPSADISVGHQLYPSDSEAAYLLINEEVADDNSTYICVVGAKGGDSATATSSFKMNGALPNKNMLITDFKIMCRGQTDTYASGNATITLTLSNITASANITSFSGLGYNTEESTDIENKESFLIALNNYIKNQDVDLILTLTTNITVDNNTKASDERVPVTQLYMELTYEEIETGIYAKINNAWYAASQAFQKSNGSWVAITMDQCKSIMQSSLLKAGVLNEPETPEVPDPPVVPDPPSEPDTPTYTPPNLVDFEYTDNGNDTYTLTAWKGTYNGSASTKLIIPDDSRIIL